MTYSLEYYFGILGWKPLLVAFAVAFVILIIVYIIPKDEYGKEIKQEKPRKLTINEKLINIAIVIITVCILVTMLLFVLSKLGDDLILIDCVNCTTLGGL